MTVTEDLGTQYHQQDTNYYCGAASAQMVLEDCGVGLLDQVGLYNDNHSHSTTESGWATGPDGLTWTLNNRQFSKYFVLDALSTEDAISRMLAWTIHHYQVAPVALVFGWQHWIVVRGFTASAAPTSSTDVSYTIDGFDVNNPWPPTPSPGPPPPHTAGDVCGTGGNRGVADEHISYTTWRDTYMTGVPGGHWVGKFVAVCDPEPPPTQHPDHQAPHRPRFDRARLIEARQAVELSDKAIEGIGLNRRDNWRKALDATKIGDPVLVQRLDRPDDFYWIVPRGRGDATTAMVSIDALSGEYMQAWAVPEAQRSTLLALDREQVSSLVVDTLHELPDLQGRLMIRPEVATISNHWVWRPCRESLSPYYPFKMVGYGDNRLYVRSDGQVFTSLTTTDRGI
jgi:hypothetical protein